MKRRITPMTWKYTLRPMLAGLALGAAVLWAQNALATPVEPLENIGKETGTCARAIARQERHHGIPAGLLKAISHAESGRWNALEGEILAWPWTVTTGGKGYFLPNRADAVAFVKSLQADGVENIDVGCLQINLKYHPDAFASIEHAFDPDANARYAARFLRQRYAASQSWIQAAGDYHSTTAHLNQAYRDKVAKLWRTAQQTPAEAQNPSQGPSQGPSPDQPQAQTGVQAAPRIAAVDVQRTHDLNQTFRLRRQNGVYTGQGAAIANRVNALQPGAPLARPAGQSREDAFRQAREAQLQAWRASQVR